MEGHNRRVGSGATGGVVGVPVAAGVGVAGWGMTGVGATGVGPLAGGASSVLDRPMSSSHRTPVFGCPSVSPRVMPYPVIRVGSI